MSSISDYESGCGSSGSDFEEDFDITDVLKKRNCQLQKQTQELKLLLSNTLNRLQIASISADDKDFKLLNSKATTSFDSFKDNCHKIVDKLEKHCLKTETLDEALTCLLCCSAPKEYAFVSCFHLIACEECAEKCHECPICRKKVNDTFKIYMN